MAEIILAIFAILIGSIFTFVGYSMMRILFPLWGLVAGYWLGAEIVHLITGDGFLQTTLSIVVGIIFALAGALLAYLYYAAAVLFFMGLVGYWLGAGIITLLGFTRGVISTLVGLALAVVFVLAGLIGNAPKLYLIVVTSFGGAGLSVAGLLLLINIVQIADLEDGAYAAVSDQHVFWRLVALGIGVVGLLSQLTATRQQELQWALEWKEAKKAGAQ